MSDEIVFQNGIPQKTILRLFIVALILAVLGGIWAYCDLVAQWGKLTAALSGVMALFIVFGSSFLAIMIVDCKLESSKHLRNLSRAKHANISGLIDLFKHDGKEIKDVQFLDGDLVVLIGKNYLRLDPETGKFWKKMEIGENFSLFELMLFIKGREETQETIETWLIARHGLAYTSAIMRKTKIPTQK